MAEEKAKVQDDAEKKPRKPRRPNRTPEEQIEDIRRKAAARVGKRREKAEAQVTTLQDKIVKAESRLGDMYTKLEAAQAELAAVDATEAAVTD